MAQEFFFFIVFFFFLAFQVPNRPTLKMIVCCLSTQNFQAGSVGGKKIFLVPVQEDILRLNYE